LKTIASDFDAADENASDELDAEEEETTSSRR